MITDEMVIAAQNGWGGAEENGEDNIDELWRAAIEAAERAAWQPIETAPTTGERILLVSDDGCIDIGFMNKYWKWDDGDFRSDMGPFTRWRHLPDAP